MSNVVTLIAVMREVATFVGFYAERMSSYETGDKSLYQRVSAVWQIRRVEQMRFGMDEGKSACPIFFTERAGNTRRSVQSQIADSIIIIRRRLFMADVMRITLKAYDHQLIDSSAAKIVENAKKTGSKVSGPVPLPTKKEIITILRATHKYKDSREQFEQRTHKRLIDIIEPSQKTRDALSRLEMPAGVYIGIKMITK